MRVLVAGVVALLLASVLSAQLQVDAPGDVTAVLLINGAQSVQMKNSMASSRRLFGIAPISSKQYFALSGAKAAIRTTSTTPVFQFEVDPAFSEDVYLFRFDVHSNKRRFGGFLDTKGPSYTNNFGRDRSWSKRYETISDETYRTSSAGRILSRAQLFLF